MLDCFCDYDAPEFYSCARPTAAREHRCYECGGTIKPGERYERVSGKWYGHFDEYKTCERCCDLRQWVQNNVPCFCWAHGNMQDDAAEAIYEARQRAPAETVGLYFGFLRRRHRIAQHNNAARVPA